MRVRKREVIGVFLYGDELLPFEGTITKIFNNNEYSVLLEAGHTLRTKVSPNFKKSGKKLLIGDTVVVLAKHFHYGKGVVNKKLSL